MILLVNSNESENKLDYVLKHMGSEEYLEYRERDGLTVDEAYQYLKRCEEKHLDWRTGRPISEDASTNRNAVYALLDTFAGHDVCVQANAWVQPHAGHSPCKSCFQG